MEDLFKKIPSLVKSSSKKSSYSSSRSTTPSPPPATLPPPLPAPDIPIQLPVGPLPSPPPMKTGSSLDAPIPSTSPPPLTLTQTTVLQRDKAARVFEHSPLSNSLSLFDNSVQYQEQVRKQRGRYRFRSESSDKKELSSRSLSPQREVGTDRMVKKKKKRDELDPPLSPTVTPTVTPVAEKVRSGPPTTFEEILGIDGTPEFDFNSSDNFAFGVSGSEAMAFGTGSTIRRMRKSSITGAYTDPTTPIWAEQGSPYTVEFGREIPSTSLISAEVEPRVVSSDIQICRGPFPTLDVETEVPTNEKDREDNLQSAQGGSGGYASRVMPHVGPCDESRSLPASPTFSNFGTSDSESEDPSTWIIQEYGTSIPQVDGNCALQLPEQDNSSSTPTQLLLLPDPFGFQATIPTQSAVRIAEEGHRAPFLQRLKGMFASKAKNIKARTVHVLTAGTDLNDSTAGLGIHREGSGEPDDDMGARKAEAVTRSWNRTDLVTCYVFLVILTTYFGLGAVNSLLIIKQSLNDWAARGEIKVYQSELALSMLAVTRVLGIMPFAKLTNTYSRPFALFIAIIFAIGGVALSAFGVTWESFCAGHTLFQFGRSGALVVAQVIVADISDLSWRGFYIWGLEFSLVFWVWAIPVTEKLFTGKLGWHIPIWIFFSFAFPASIPPIIATYVFHRRAAHLGFFPAIENVHQRVWWSMGGFTNRLELFIVQYDTLGVLLWTIGVGLLATVLSLSEKMHAGMGRWIVGILIGGTLSIITLVLWEIWLNNGQTVRKLAGQESPSVTHSTRPMYRHRPTGRFHKVAFDERTTISGPAGYDSASVGRVAAQISARIMASQDPKNVAKWRDFSSFRERTYPLFRTRLLKRRTVPLGCLIGFLASFATKAGAWIVWEHPENLPPDYRQLVELVQGKGVMANVEFTSLIIAGLFVSLMVRVTKLFKRFVVSGLLLIMSGLLFFHSTDIYLAGQRRLIFSQTLTGLGAGTVWIGLMVGVQASFGEMTAEAMKRLMQTYLLDLLPNSSSQEDFIHALNGHWSVMLLIAIVAVAFALVMAGIGLSGVSFVFCPCIKFMVAMASDGWKSVLIVLPYVIQKHNLDEVKQHVSGIVFGIDDKVRKGEEHPSWATPEPFIQTRGGGNTQPPGLASLQLGTIEETTRDSGEMFTVLQELQGGRLANSSHLTSGDAAASSFAESQAQTSSNGVVRNLKLIQGRESTADWETSTSESRISESRTTSNSHTNPSPARVPNSYMDGVFTMDMDMERTPRAATSSIPRLYFNEDLPSLTPNTPDRSENTIKRYYHKNRPKFEPAEGSILGGGQEFSFRKREIKEVIRGKANPGKNQEEKTTWSDSASIDSENISINVVSSVSDENSESQFDPPINRFGIPSQTPSSGSPGTSQVSLEISSEELAFTSIGVEMPSGQERGNSEIDGRVSRLSCSGIPEDLTLTQAPAPANTSQLSIVDISEEVDALTEKNRHSLEGCLSPILELSSQGSFENLAVSLLESSPVGGHPSSRELPEINHQSQDAVLEEEFAVVSAKVGKCQKESR